MNWESEVTLPHLDIFYAGAHVLHIFTLNTYHYNFTVLQGNMATDLRCSNQEPDLQNHMIIL